jgi:hypothetical protein
MKLFLSVSNSFRMTVLTPRKEFKKKFCLKLFILILEILKKN